VIIGGLLQIKKAEHKRGKQVEKLSTDTIKFQTSHAILLVSGKYVLQLRDNKPTIASAGKWSLFGGMINRNETPLQAINREILEELSIKPAEYRYLWFADYHSDFLGEVVRTWFFASDVTELWSEYKLMEGQDAGVFSLGQIRNLNMPSVIRDTIERFHNQVESA